MDPGTEDIQTKGRPDGDHALTGAGSWRDLGWKVSAGWDETDHWRDRREGQDVFRGNTTLQYKPDDGLLFRLSAGMSSGKSEFFGNVGVGLGHYGDPAAPMSAGADRGWGRPGDFY